MHALCAERFGTQCSGHRRVDAARDADDDVVETVLLDVVAETEDQSEPHLLELGGERHHHRLKLAVLDAWAVELDGLHRRSDLARASELTATCVAEPAASGVDGIQVDEQKLLGEAGGAGDDFARVVEDDGVAVEDEFVLSADEIAEREVGARVASARHEHLLTVLGLADVERRRREVHDQLRSREREVRRRRARLPDVLADREPNGRLPDPEEDEFTALREVAVLVEHAVVREEVFAVDRLHASVGAHGTRVREIAVEPRGSDQRGDALRLGRDRLERLL